MFLRKMLGSAVFIKECGNQEEGLIWVRRIVGELNP